MVHVLRIVPTHTHTHTNLFIFHFNGNKFAVIFVQCWNKSSFFFVITVKLVSRKILFQFNGLFSSHARYWKVWLCILNNEKCTETMKKFKFEIINSFAVKIASGKSQANCFMVKKIAKYQNSKKKLTNTKCVEFKINAKRYNWVWRIILNDFLENVYKIREFF